MEPRAAYIHVPFCRHRCGYCNFTVIAGRDDLVDAFLDALELELRQLERPRPVDTLFLGGGTPTHLGPEQLNHLLTIVTDWFPLAGDGEFSVEANPIDLVPETISVLSDAGVNRASLGIQSFNDAKLRILERDHRRERAIDAVNACRESFTEISLDLIFGAPGETFDQWRQDLQTAIDLQPSHLSTYGLTIEKGSAFWGRQNRGKLNPADEELQRAMFLTAIDELTANGWEHYEVSNFAWPGHRCRHNEVYWLGREYFAAGPGASRYVDGVRETNHRSTTAWLRRIREGRSPVAERERLVPEDKARECLVFELRMLDGIDTAEFQRKTGFDVQQLVGKPLAELLRQGMFEQSGTRLRLTREGLLVSDAIWPKFLVPCQD